MPPLPQLVSLRPWALADAPRMATLVNNPAVYHTLAAALPVPYRVEHAHEFIRSCNSHPHMMWERAILLEDIVVGTIGAQLEGACARLGYWLGEPWWQQGIMTQALPLFISQLPPSITLLQAKCFDFNLASMALLQRCGFSPNPAATTTELAKDGEQHPVFLFERTR